MFHAAAHSHNRCCCFISYELFQVYNFFEVFHYIALFDYNISSHNRTEIILILLLYKLCYWYFNNTISRLACYTYAFMLLYKYCTYKNASEYAISAVPKLSQPRSLRSRSKVLFLSRSFSWSLKKYLTSKIIKLDNCIQYSYRDFTRYSL